MDVVLSLGAEERVVLVEGFRDCVREYVSGEDIDFSCGLTVSLNTFETCHSFDPVRPSLNALICLQLVVSKGSVLSISRPVLEMLRSGSSSDQLLSHVARFGQTDIPSEPVRGVRMASATGDVEEAKRQKIPKTAEDADMHFPNATVEDLVRTARR